MTSQSPANRLLALLFGGALVVAACYYPLQRTIFLPLLLVYIALIAWRWQLWLMAIPSMLPICDLAPWTGWFCIEELDLLLLSTAAVGYWRRASPGLTALLPMAPSYAVAGLTGSYLISIFVGLLPPHFPDGDFPANYLSPYNSLRIGKAWCWFLILLPLLKDSAGSDLAGIRRYLFPGVVAGLLIVALADLRERVLFPGLINFSIDYRTSAPFSGMHMGGAALDGYLALATPFAAAGLFRQAGWRRLVGIPAFGLVLYAGLSTFSRGLFAAYACSAGIFGVLHLFCRYGKRPSWRIIVPISVMAALLAAAFSWIFASAGYRGLAAALVTLLAAYILSAIPERPALPQAHLQMGTGAILGTLSLALPTVLLNGDQHVQGVLKPPYLLFALSASLFVLAASGVLTRVTRFAHGATGAIVVAFVAMLLSMGWIGWHWAGDAASGACVVLALLALAIVAINRISRPPLWKLDLRGLSVAIVMIVVLGLSIPVSLSYYASERLGSVTEDLQTRMRHWRNVVGLMEAKPLSPLFGMGAGSFPITYYWSNPAGEFPPTINYPVEAGNRYLSLTPGAYTRGYGELLRVLQRIELHPWTLYRLGIDIRRSTTTSFVHLGICERLLLYPQNCLNIPLHLTSTIGRWQHYQAMVDSGALGSAPWYARPPVQLELAVEGGPGVVDFDNLSLEGSDGQLLLNGSFQDANRYWFSSSDRYHLPWHIKNLILNVYFEMGSIGVFFLGLWLAVTLIGLLTSSQKNMASIYVASITGFMVVGLFDSLLDVPRLALLFFLIVGAAGLRKNRQKTKEPMA